MKLVLTNSEGSRAVILPDRGGLLSQLELVRPRRASSAGNTSANKAEVLWTAPQFDATGSGWPSGGMPLMFPFAGRVFHEGTALQYELGGKIWRMPLHGFAYAEKWQLIEQREDAVELGLRATAASRELFPFEFDLRVRHVLAANHILSEVNVICERGLLPAAPRMPVSLGWHPYFKLPATLAESRGPLSLNTSAKTQVRVTATGAAGRHGPFPDELTGDSEDLLNPHLSNLILAELGQRSAVVGDLKADLKIRLEWSEAFRYLVLWSQAGQGFHCVEPWMGLPDALNNGAGLRWLAPGESLRASFTVALE